MENKKNGGNGILIVIIVILLGVIAFCAYKIGTTGRCVVDDSNLQKGGNTSVPVEEEITDNSIKAENEINNTKGAATIFYENMVKNRTVYEDNVHGINIVLDKNGNVYYSSKDNNPENIKGAVGVKGQYSIDGYIAASSSYGISNVLKGYKLNISNVVLMYYGSIGNSGEEYVFIKSDGTIARLVYWTTYDTETLYIKEFEENFPGCKNIVSVVSSNNFDAHDYNLIDISGNTYKLWECSKMT